MLDICLLYSMSVSLSRDERRVRSCVQRWQLAPASFFLARGADLWRTVASWQGWNVPTVDKLITRNGQKLYLWHLWQATGAHAGQGSELGLAARPPRREGKRGMSGASGERCVGPGNGSGQLVRSLARPAMPVCLPAAGAGRGSLLLYCCVDDRSSGRYSCRGAWLPASISRRTSSIRAAKAGSC
jgi:hypothetical protein